MEDDIMSKFIDNYNKYLESINIKRAYLSKIIGYDENKFSRILNKKQDITSTEMETFSKVFGLEPTYFLKDDFKVEIKNEYNRISFYIGNPTEKQEKIADKIQELFENLDSVFSADSI